MVRYYSVVGESPAELGGVQEGDVIIRFDNKNITDPSNLRNIVSLMPPGSKSDVVVFRNGSKRTLACTSGAEMENKLPLVILQMICNRSRA